MNLPAQSLDPMQQQLSSSEHSSVSLSRGRLLFPRRDSKSSTGSSIKSSRSRSGSPPFSKSCLPTRASWSDKGIVEVARGLFTDVSLDMDDPLDPTESSNDNEHSDSHNSLRCVTANLEKRDLKMEESYSTDDNTKRPATYEAQNIAKVNTPHKSVWNTKGEKSEWRNAGSGDSSSISKQPDIRGKHPPSEQAPCKPNQQQSKSVSATTAKMSTKTELPLTKAPKSHMMFSAKSKLPPQKTESSTSRPLVRSRSKEKWEAAVGISQRLLKKKNEELTIDILLGRIRERKHLDTKTLQQRASELQNIQQPNHGQQNDNAAPKRDPNARSLPSTSSAQKVAKKQVPFVSKKTESAPKPAAVARQDGIPSPTCQSLSISAIGNGRQAIHKVPEAASHSVGSASMSPAGKKSPSTTAAPSRKRNKPSAAKTENSTKVPAMDIPKAKQLEKQKSELVVKPRVKGCDEKTANSATKKPRGTKASNSNVVSTSSPKDSHKRTSKISKKGKTVAASDSTAPRKTASAKKVEADESRAVQPKLSTSASPIEDHTYIDPTMDASGVSITTPDATSSSMVRPRRASLASARKPSVKRPSFPTNSLRSSRNLVPDGSSKSFKASSRSFIVNNKNLKSVSAK